jgi:putative phosphonate metabolism protein
MFTRYAIYYTPDGALAEAGAAWLGWDVAQGSAASHPDVSGIDLATLTDTPRKYGFHGTLKPPFVLRSGTSPDQLRKALADFCAARAPVTLDGLAVRQMGRFVALTPLGDLSTLRQLAADIVRGFDTFRAPPSEAELARRRAANLSPAQEQNLVTWGYPYVMDQFRFHMTLTGRLVKQDRPGDVIAAHFNPVLPAPFAIAHLTLAGERADGMFQEIIRLPLGNVR